MSTRQVDDAYAASYETRWGEGWVYVRDGRLIGVDLPGEAAGPCTRWWPRGRRRRPAPPTGRRWPTGRRSSKPTSPGSGPRGSPPRCRLDHLAPGAFEQAVYRALDVHPAGRDRELRGTGRDGRVSAGGAGRRQRHGPQPDPRGGPLPPGHPLGRHHGQVRQRSHLERAAAGPRGVAAPGAAGGGRPARRSPRPKGAERGRPPGTIAHDSHHGYVRGGQVRGCRHLRGHGLLLHRQPASADAAAGGGAVRPGGEPSGPGRAGVRRARRLLLRAARPGAGPSQGDGHPLPAPVPRGFRRSALGALPV